MTDLQILVLEDEELHAEKIQFCLEKLGYTQIYLANSFAQAETLLEKMVPDLLISDINLHGEKTGVDFVERFRQDYSAPVIFVTALRSQETFERAKLTHPDAFLVKPVNKDSLIRAIELSVAQYQGDHIKKGEARLQENDSIFVRKGNYLRRVQIKDIKIAEVSEEKYCDLFTEDGKYSIRRSLSGLDRVLPNKVFVRVHRTFIVNLHFIEGINEKDQTILIGGQEVPIGKTFRKDLMQKVNLF